MYKYVAFICIIIEFYLLCSEFPEKADKQLYKSSLS